MGKATLLVLVIAALLYAAWLRLLRKDSPDPQSAVGLRKKFLTATSLFLLFFSSVGGATAADETRTRKIPPEISQDELDRITDYPSFLAAIKAIWVRMLDRETYRKGDLLIQSLRENRDINTIANTASNKGIIRQSIGSLLTHIHLRLASHAAMQSARMTCYRTELVADIRSVNSALKQVELLQKQKQENTLDEETLQKIYQTLATDFEVIRKVENNRSEQVSRLSFDELCQQIRAGEVTATNSSEEAAGILFDMMEIPQPKTASPQARLERMKENFKKLIHTGPAFNDWNEPKFNPTILDMLASVDAYLNISPGGVECYRRTPSTPAPSADRIAAVKELQKELLLKSSVTDVLDPDTLSKVITTDEEKVLEFDSFDGAADRDILTYQKLVRRAMRILYNHGEVPPYFIRKVEQVIDASIIHFDPKTALREDMRWFLRPLAGADITADLEKRGLIPPAHSQNHRLERIDRDGSMHIPAFNRNDEMYHVFFAMLDNKQACTFPNDTNEKIPLWQVPDIERDYRLQMRYVFRCLIASGICQQLSLREDFEEILGLSLTGTIEDK